MKLLIEEIEEPIEYISEGTGDDKSHYITGIFMQAEVVNGNKRRYPLEIMEKEVDRYNKNYVNENRAFGELGHPDNPKINLHLASHLITELKRDGNNFIGKAKIMDTPNGKIVQHILNAGGNFGVSSRALGSVKLIDGINEVQNDFHLATAADIVADPSAPDAMVQGIMEEKTWIMESGVWKEQDLMEAKTAIRDAAKADIELVIMEQFQSLIGKL